MQPEPPPSAEVGAATALATVKAVQANASNLGLTWTVSPATVVEILGLYQVRVIGDADLSASPVTAVNTTGFALPLGARVYVTMVPTPDFSSQVLYVSGVMGGQSQATANGELCAMLSTAGTVVSTEPEAVVPTASWAYEPLATYPQGHLFEAEIWSGGYTLAAAPRILFLRIRQGQATTGGQLLVGRPMVVTNLISGAGGTIGFTGYFTNSSSADVTTRLTVTAQNPGGATGLVALYGDANQPLQVVIRDLGPAVLAPESMRALAINSLT